MMYVGGLSKVA